MPVEVTDEQLREMKGPVEIQDGSTGRLYVIIPKEAYESYKQMAEALENDSDPSLFEFDDIELFDG